MSQATTAEKLLTVEEYAQLPDRGQPTELVKGKVVKMNPPAFRHGEVCGNVTWIMKSHVMPNRLGRIVCNDTGVITERNPDTLRGADVAYYSCERVPPGPVAEGYLEVTPEIVFEIRSPHDRWPDILAKVSEYLNAGVLAVCVLDPAQETLRVFRADETDRILTRDDELTFPAILDDFRVKVGEFFASI